MSFLTGSPKSSYQPAVTGDTTALSYWLNWRVLLCALWVFISMIFASFLISRYEGARNNSEQVSRGETRKDGRCGILYADEVWKPCLKGMHPGWLLAFRAVAFCVMLILLIVNVIVDGADIFYYYTQWTFTLVTFYFGLGSLLSIYGCYEYYNKVGGDRTDNATSIDVEQVIYQIPAMRGPKNMSSNDGGGHNHQARQVAGCWGYVFQVTFQMNAGAVMLTDFVFWFFIVPFLAMKDYDLNFLIINMHTINAVFLLGDTALNCLQFPWFRIAYFFLWTAFYVIFQWIVHACLSLWWPYPILDLSSAYSPLWYSVVAIMHIPCYGVFVLIMKLKHFLLSKYFPESYRYAR